MSTSPDAAAATGGDAAPVPANGPTSGEMAEYHAAISQQVEYYFSPENLSRDAYLKGQMNATGHVRLSLIATFRRVRELVADIDTLVEALRESKVLEVVTDNETAELMVRAVMGGITVYPLHAMPQRTTLILRDIVPHATQADIYSLFINPSRPVVSVHPEIGSSWFVAFATEDACKEEFLRLQSGMILLHGQVVRARIKSESVPIQVKGGAVVNPARDLAAQNNPYDIAMMQGYYPYGFPPGGYGGAYGPPFFGGGAPSWGYDGMGGGGGTDRGRGQGNKGRGGRDWKNNGGNNNGGVREWKNSGGRGGGGNNTRKPYNNSGRGGGVATLPKADVPIEALYPQLTPAPPGQVQRYSRSDFLAVFESMRIMHAGNLPICASMTDSEGCPCVLHGPNRDIESLPPMVLSSHHREHNREQPAPMVVKAPAKGGGGGLIAAGIVNTATSRPSFAQIAGKAPPPRDASLASRMPPIRPPPDDRPPPTEGQPQRYVAPSAQNRDVAPIINQQVQQQDADPAADPTDASQPLFNFGSNSLASRLRGGPGPGPIAKPASAAGVIQQPSLFAQQESGVEDLVAAVLPSLDDDDSWATHVMGSVRTK